MTIVCDGLVCFIDLKFPLYSLKKLQFPGTLNRSHSMIGSRREMIETKQAESKNATVDSCFEL